MIGSNRARFCIDMTSRRMKFGSLPPEVLTMVVAYLPKADRCSARLSCRLLRDTIDSASCVWKNKEINLKNVREYDEKTWALLKRRRILKVSLPYNEAALGLVYKLLRYHPAVQSLTAYCPNFNNFFYTEKKMLKLLRINLQEIHLFLDNWHFGTGKCRCIEVLKNEFRSVKRIRVTVRALDSGSHLTEKFFQELHESLPSITEVTIINPPLPSARLLADFGPRFRPPKYFDLLPALRKSTGWVINCNIKIPKPRTRLLR